MVYKQWLDLWSYNRESWGSLPAQRWELIQEVSFCFLYSVQISHFWKAVFGVVSCLVLQGFQFPAAPGSLRAPAVAGCGIFTRRRGTLRPDCHILAYQSTEVERTEYNTSPSLFRTAICGKRYPPCYCNLQNNVQFHSNLYCAFYSFALLQSTFRVNHISTGGNT